MAGRTLAKHTAGEPDHHTPVPGTRERAGELTVPVLALNGALDTPELAALAEHFAGGRTVTVEGAAHYPNMEQPDAYNRAVADFADAVYAGRAANG
jgi:pimeloyl-ACP methyl ester carboxylesterase